MARHNTLASRGVQPLSQLSVPHNRPRCLYCSTRCQRSLQPRNRKASRHVGVEKGPLDRGRVGCACSSHLAPMLRCHCLWVLHYRGQPHLDPAPSNCRVISILKIKSQAGFGIYKVYHCQARGSRPHGKITYQHLKIHGIKFSESNAVGSTEAHTRGHF